MIVIGNGNKVPSNGTLVNGTIMVTSTIMVTINGNGIGNSNDNGNGSGNGNGRVVMEEMKR